VLAVCSLMAPLDLLWQLVLAMRCCLGQAEEVFLQGDTHVPVAELTVASECS